MGRRMLGQEPRDKHVPPQKGALQKTCGGGSGGGGPGGPQPPTWDAVGQGSFLGPELPGMGRQMAEKGPGLWPS